MSSVPIDLRSWLYSPQFPDTWESHSLYSLADWLNGMAFRDFQFSDTGKPVIKIAELKNGITGQTKFTEGSYAKEYLIESGDMLFAWSGQPDSSLDVFYWRGEDGWLNQLIFKLTPHDNCDDRFFFYILKYLNPNFVQIARNKQTTGLGHVTKKDLERLEVSIPTLPVQREIAQILGAFDDKIELNRRMNETLEALARALFKCWFVDFTPVRIKAEAVERSEDPNAALSRPASEGGLGLAPDIAALFPDSFEDSELGEIPGGWEVGKLGMVAREVRNQADPKTLESETPYIGLEHMPRHSIQLSEWGHSGNVTSGKSWLEKGNILFGKLRPYFHKVGIAPVKGVCSTDIVVIDAVSPDWYMLALAHLSSDEFVEYTNRSSTGTKMPRTSWRIMADYEIVLPDKRIAAAFTEIGLSLTALLDTQIRQGRSLAETRDLVLPELMSGALGTDGYNG